jgi:GNAT superfamily N-acetyltransferase
VTDLPHRLATPEDAPAIAALAEASIGALLPTFLTPPQVAASRAIMGLDSQLIADRTYFVIEDGPQIVAAGGWSRRATAYGGDHSAGRDAALLDPANDSARVRAMYTHPHYVRRGLGRRILDLCHAAATAEGFRRTELTATLAGAPLYRAAGYAPVRTFEDASGGAPVPLTVMTRALPWKNVLLPLAGEGGPRSGSDEGSIELSG